LMEDHLPAGEAPRAREVLINRRPVVERGGHVQTARCGFIRIQRRDDGGTTGKEVRGSGGTRGGERRRGVRACDRRDRWPSAIAATGKEQWGKQLEPTGHANHWSLQWEQRTCRGLTTRRISRGWNTRHPNSTRGSLSHGQSLSPPCRSSRMELGIAAPLHVGIDGVDLGRGESQRAPSGHAFRRPSPADCLQEYCFIGDRSVWLERQNQVGSEGRARHILAVAPGAVEIEILPPLV